MGSLILPELSSDFKFTAKSCVRRTIGGETLPHVSRIRGVSEKILKLEDYASRLRDEMKKVDAFKRELPLCLLLLRDAIVATEDELAQCRKSSAEPVLEEFIPMKRICRDEGFDKVESRRDREDSCRDKMNWMSSVQLWNSADHPSPDTELNSDKLTLKLDDTNKKRTEEEMNLFQNGKSRTVVKPLVPFAGCTNFPVMPKGKDDRHEFPIPNLSLCTPELKSSIEGLNSIGFSPKSCSSRSGSPSSANVQSNLRTGDHQSARKQRRCWSSDLHRQFINALQQLGGAQVATPKQIRELMQVDGLTNDEVKSHLQINIVFTVEGSQQTLLLNRLECGCLKNIATKYESVCIQARPKAHSIWKALPEEMKTNMMKTTSIRLCGGDNVWIIHEFCRY